MENRRYNMKQENGGKKFKKEKFFETFLLIFGSVILGVFTAIVINI